MEECSTDIEQRRVVFIILMEYRQLAGNTIESDCITVRWHHRT